MARNENVSRGDSLLPHAVLPHRKEQLKVVSGRKQARQAVNLLHTPNLMCLVARKFLHSNILL